MDYKTLALNLANEAGKIIKQNFELGMERTMKADGSPVTKTDLAINRLVVEEVKKNFPGHAVLGEEESHPILDAEYVWVCDPVDGTIPFSHGMPTCMFSLALCHNGAPVLGAACDPFLDRMFFAEKGKGAFLNGKKIAVSNHKTLDGAIISHCLWNKMKYPMPKLMDDAAFQKNVQPFGINSIVYNAMLLSAGQMEGITFGHDTAHDVAAIKIIVEEAGGKATDLKGNEQRYDMPVYGCVISNGLIHAEFLKLIQEHLG